jgi:hypothetical protein
MIILDVTAIGSVFLGVALACVGLYFYSRLKRDLRFLVVYFVIAACSDTIGTYLSFKSINNAWLLNVFISIEYVLLSYMFSLWHKDWVRLWIRISIPLYLLVRIVRVIAYQGLDTLDGFSYLLSTVLLASMAMYTLFIFQRNIPDSSLRDPRFWVSGIVLFSFGGNLLIHAFQPTVVTWSARNVITILAKLSYAWGLIWHSRKSMHGS